MSLSNSPKDPNIDTENVMSWQFPEIDGSHSVNEALHNVKVPTASELEKIQQQASKEASEKGYQDGLAKGLQAAKAQIAQQASALQSLMRSLAKPLDELDEQVEKELTELAILVAKQLIRRELKMDSGQVVSVVKEAIAALPSSSQNIKLHLHPEDASLVKSALSLDETEFDGWKVVDDPVMTRGGCRVQTDSSQIDATVENRLSTIIAKALGDERGN